MGNKNNRIDSDIRPIVKELERICAMGYSPYNVFDDWLDLMMHAFCRNEPEYLAIVKKYKNTASQGEREIDFMCGALSHLMIHMQATNEETLGEIYQQWNLSHHRAGQFFTPPAISAMIVRMIKPHGRISDPACGAGSMLVEACKSMTNEQLDAAWFVGQDIDSTCVKMTALNMMFFNMNGVALVGDTLKMEVRAGWFTKRSYTGGAMRAMTQEEVATYNYKPEPVKEQPQLPQAPDQLSLFERLAS